MRYPISLMLILLGTVLMSAQTVQKFTEKITPNKDVIYFEGTTPQPNTCISLDQRAEMIDGIKREVTALRKNGNLLSDNPALKNMGSLQWPLQTNNYDACGYYSIFQYFDHDMAYGSVQDWNCGTITYDVPGYNHRGTDIGITPFAWNMMNDNSVEVIAAASGQIVQRLDGNFDMECAGGGGSWNYVVIRHADGSYAMYGHMKNGSVTSLQVGDQVNTGDYLGLVGSSGASTGPHLHFEILSAEFESLDPYHGPCNNQSQSSMWANQNDYHDKGINVVKTHSAPPDNNTCPELETINEQTIFEPGSQIYLGVYLRHALSSDSFTLSLIRPDGTTYWTTNHTPSSFYASYMFYFSTYIGYTEQEGEWSLVVDASYGDSCSSAFIIGDCDEDLVLNGPVEAGVGLIKEEASNSITSTSVINSESNVIYDAGNSVELNPGFEVKQSALFEAYLDGCGGL